MAKGAKKGKGGLGVAVGAAALGLGAGLAAERWLIGRTRGRPDAFAKEAYGKLLPDRSYEVSTKDSAVLLVNEFGPSDVRRGTIFLHGYCLDHSIWHHQMTGLDSDMRHVFYDARHHGRSRGGHDATSVGLLASDLQAVIDRSGLQEVVLVGHSMGGMTVLQYCCSSEGLAGSKVRGIVLVNTTYTDAIKTLFAAEVIGPVERATRGIFQKLFNDPRASQLVRLRGDDLSYILVKLFGFGPGASKTQVEYIRRLLAVFPTQPLIETMRGLRDFDVEDALNSVDVPTLVIAGGDDRITTVRASRHLAKEIPGARLVIFDKAGHTSMMERNVDFNHEIRRFLSGVFAPIDAVTADGT